MNEVRGPEKYTLKDEPGEQLTPMGDDWYVVHHTAFPSDDWWAVRHQCDDGNIYGMAWLPGHTVCNGCRTWLPTEIDGFITMLEWKR